MIIRYIFWAFAIYFLVRFIFNFLVPVVRATSRMKQQVRDFQEKMQENQHPSSPGHERPQSSKPKTGDYIDFEEVR